PIVKQNQSAIPTGAHIHLDEVQAQVNGSFISLTGVFGRQKPYSAMGYDLDGTSWNESLGIGREHTLADIRHDPIHAEINQAIPQFCAVPFSQILGQHSNSSLVTPVNERRSDLTCLKLYGCRMKLPDERIKVVLFVRSIKRNKGNRPKGRLIDSC